MTHSTVTHAEALRRLVAEVKLLTAAEVGERWNQLGGAIGVAEMVLRDGEKQEPFAFVIINEHGGVEFSTNTHDEAQAHINEAISEFCVEGAGKWRSIPAHEMRPSDDALWDQTMRERDYNAEIADKLADAIAEYFGADIGEHSSANCPWLSALNVIEEAAPAPSPQVVAAVPGWQLVPKQPTPEMVNTLAEGNYSISITEAYVEMLKIAPQPAPGSAAPSGDVERDAIRDLISLHAEELDQNDYAYFELARTRRTDWMAWICSNLRDDDPVREVLATGQGSTPDEACAAAVEDYKARAAITATKE